jgi:hypothetical protein
MADETKAQRMSRLCDEIGFDLGNGTIDANKAREFRWLLLTTPDQEFEGGAIRFKQVDAELRRLEQELSSTTGVYRRIPVTTGTTGPSSEVYD